MKESKEDRFKRLTEARITKIVKMMRLLGNCANPAFYAYTQEQADQIIQTLLSELELIQEKFLHPLKKHFRLSDGQKPVMPRQPAYICYLPDGSQLRVVSDGVISKSGITIYWSGGASETPQPVCFAQYEQSAKHQLYVGAYRTGQDGPAYYAPFLEENK